ncbi:hypothetical protein RB614_18735 [Phytohabitans sp. ZYX-F-186]|uniref:Uncharacterized protein n=1 Tax=Phytohabitans maris TaxID=3071409 RepID=A0ABU0ZHM1_9ACTN|nr:hypothetical protein [Phytohabitans sp. ZYX-F-186]MDQ7906555.1 hypothetical protein [Phytohabitans sp. ZYX-F-186]
MAAALGTTDRPGRTPGARAGVTVEGAGRVDWDRRYPARGVERPYRVG